MSLMVAGTVGDRAGDDGASYARIAIAAACRMLLRAGSKADRAGTDKFQRDPHWWDNLLFYEHFHGDNGAGIGASNQTGWTGVIAGLIEVFGKLDAPTLLQGGGAAAY